jgi:hypothetical protein
MAGPGAYGRSYAGGKPCSAISAQFASPQIALGSTPMLPIARERRALPVLHGSTQAMTRDVRRNAHGSAASTRRDHAWLIRIPEAGIVSAKVLLPGIAACCGSNTGGHFADTQTKRRVR